MMIAGNSNFPTGLFRTAAVSTLSVRLIPSGVRSNSHANNQRNRKPKCYQHDRQADRPIRDVENWENLRNPLSQRPASDNITDGDSVNVTPLQLAKERLSIHDVTI